MTQIVRETARASCAALLRERVVRDIKLSNPCTHRAEDAHVPNYAQPEGDRPRFFYLDVYI